MSLRYEDDDDVFGSSSSRFLSPSKTAPRKSPSRQTLNGHRSTASLRGKSKLTPPMDDDAVNGRHSLAHELAAALMPEPTVGAKSLAEEFGIEYDEGAEGIDERMQEPAIEGHVLANELEIGALDALGTEAQILMIEPPVEDISSRLGSPLSKKRHLRSGRDPMADLSRDLETTDKFLTHLRRLDADSMPTSTTASLEKIASDMIRHINETARDREGQVRELLEYEREFRKIAGEVGGNDVLGQLDELQEIEGLADTTITAEPAKTDSRTLDVVEEELEQVANDWEMDPDVHRFDDQDDSDSEPDSPLVTKDLIPPPPPLLGPATATKALPHLLHMRTLTASLVTTLTAISEHAQVNSASSAEAGRKLRALKNKLGGWRTDWDSAEKSRIKVERWEAGLADDDNQVLPSTPGRYSRRVDGRRIVEEHLQAFEVALAEAGTKTRAIMAAA